MIGADLLLRAQHYADRHDLTLGDRLGFGMHGIVLSATIQREIGNFALKVHEREPAYRRERDAYIRLNENAVTSVRRCNVPELIGFDDDLWVIEMTMVARPFVLDFAGAYLDEAPEFSEEVMANWHAEKAEQFGPRWPEVLTILRELEALGIFMLDVNPGNIAFAEMPRNDKSEIE